MPTIDEDFIALPLRQLADAALDKARALGVEHADIRVERIKTSYLALHDSGLETSHSGEDIGISVRVVHDGTWGFAGGVTLTTDSAAALAAEAVRVAEVSKPVTRQRISLAPEPSHGERTWISAYQIDPFSVSEAERIALLAEMSSRLMSSPHITHADVDSEQVKENKFYADLNGTMTTQQRVRVQSFFTGIHVDEATGRFETMRTLAQPAGFGWEWMTGDAWDWDSELAELPEQLAEKVKAPSIEAGNYDLVIHPSNLFLTIHESVGHATELDRALGYEANYAGTSFATPDLLGTLKYGSPVMHITGDRTAIHGLATIGFDDDGVETQSWDLVRDGTLVGYQLDRRTAALSGIDRSNGCAFADSATHVPIQRMANVSLQPAPGGPSTDDLIGGVSDGIYVVGDKSWSIDQQRYNFQFTGQRFYRIRGGKLAGQVKDVAYQATTTDFWGALEAVGGPQTYVLGGAFNCGKAQPAQSAPVSHGCPTTLFRQIRILNTEQEAGQ